MSQHSDVRPATVRFIGTVLVAVLFHLQPSHAESVGIDEWPGIDLPGQDLPGAPFSLTANDATLCANACRNNSKCKAYTFVRAYGGTPAKCWLKHSVPANRVKNSCCTSGVKYYFSTSTTGYTVEFNRNRPGDDFDKVVMDIPSASDCATKCRLQKQKCYAYTFVKPSFQGAKARCWLKFRMHGSLTADSCCISGKRTDWPAMTKEAGYDRPGSDYRNVSVSWGTCQSLCQTDSRCRSFTWVKAGVQGPAQRCYLKNAQPAKKPNSCCISGVKQGY